ncbi:MAG TPA: hypothetical protein VIV40_15530, partial [Kofleriaceae bacterium]
VPVVAEQQHSTGVATEPEGLMPSVHVLLRRGPTAIIASLIVVLTLSFAFLVRDLDNTKSAPAVATQPAPAPRPAAAHTPPVHASGAHVAPAPPSGHVSVTPIAAPAPPVPSDVHTSMALPDDEREQLLDDDEPVDRSQDKQRVSSPKRVASTKPPARPTRAVRPAPSRPTPPAHPPAPPPPTKGAASVDCSTPFYYEGSKKIFKPGCL